MTALKKPEQPAKMTFDEFMQWYEHQEGRWELHDGTPVRLHGPVTGNAERIEHARAKSAIYLALKTAIAGAGRQCEALPNGMTVAINDDVSYEPDAVVYCGERLPRGTLGVPEPIIIVEVLSPSTAYKDVGDKLRDYFTLPSVAHYLVIDPKNGHITHHYRDGKHIAQKAAYGDELSLDPPGIALKLGELFF